MKRSVLYHPDATDAAAADPILTNDLDGVSPDNPIIPVNEYDLEVIKMKDGVSEKTGSKCVEIQLKHLNPVTSTNGESIPEGRVEFARIWITPTEKRTAEAVKRDLKRFQLACGVKSGPFYPFARYEGKRLRAKIGLTKATDEYPDVRNEVKSFVVP